MLVTRTRDSDLLDVVRDRIFTVEVGVDQARRSYSYRLGDVPLNSLSSFGLFIIQPGLERYKQYRILPCRENSPLSSFIGLLTVQRPLPWVLNQNSIRWSSVVKPVVTVRERESHLLRETGSESTRLRRVVGIGTPGTASPPSMEDSRLLICRMRCDVGIGNRLCMVAQQLATPK